MQAFALQKVLGELGFNAVTINSSPRPSLIRKLARRIRYDTERLLRLEPTPLPPSPKVLAHEQKLTRSFVDRYIKTVDLFGLSRKGRNNILAETSAIVVGSDQVWRGGYANVLEQLLDYAREYSLVRISYAASFGANHLIEYSQKTLVKSRELARLFDHISVRELSGVEICRQVWGVQAEQHIDPTLLLGADEYATLARGAAETSSDTGGRILTYILDWNPGVESLVDEISEELGLSVVHFLSSEATCSQGEISGGTNCLKPVESWLRSFESSEFVVTDSFHGTVFAIIFRKSFLAIGNKARGVARFESLLTQFGLRSRLVDLSGPAGTLDLTSPDWDTVDVVLARERSRAINYLRSSLLV